MIEDLANGGETLNFPDNYGHGYANEPEQTTGQPTGAMPIITDGAIVDQADEPDDEPDATDDDKAEQDKQTADRITAMRDDEEATFRGYR